METLLHPRAPVARSPDAPIGTPRVVDVLLAYLKAEGVRFVFGIPGGLSHPFFAAVEDDPDLALIVTKHEEGAAFMADGCARVAGKLAVCAGTSGPGATNLLTGVAAACADGVPMLVITGQAASHALGKGASQESGREDIDVVAMFRPVTKYSAMVTSAVTMGHHVRRALRRALTGRPGPVHLNVPVDLWESPLVERWLDPPTYRPMGRVLDASALDQALDELFAARRPVLLAGAGVAGARAGRPLAALAELLPAAVATTPRGKGVFPEDHPLSLGVLGVGGHREAAEVLLGAGEADVLLVVGASLNEATTLAWNPALGRGKRLLHVDIDPDRIARSYPVDLGIVGDAGAVLEELVARTLRRLQQGDRPRSTWPCAPPFARGHARHAEPLLRVSDRCPVTPQRWRADLAEVLPDDAVVFSDIGGHMLFNVHDLVIGSGQRFVLNLGFGAMGHGTVAPIGAALAEPRRRVFAIVGDACFAMHGMELLVAAEHRVPVIWIVENNQMHGITWHGSALLGRQLASIGPTRPVDVGAVARAMGLFARTVDAPGAVQGAVREALAHGGPAVIEVRVDSSIPPPLEGRAASLAGFIRAGKEPR